MSTRPPLAILHPAALVLSLLVGWWCPGAQEGAKEAREAKGAKEEWHKIFIGGKAAGYLRIAERPREGGGFVASTAQKLVVRRGVVALDTEGSSAVEEDAAGRVRAFRLVQKTSREPVEISGTAEDGTLAVTETVGGKNPRASRIPLDPEAIGPHRFEEAAREKLKKPGDAFEAKVFIPELRKVGSQRSVLEKEEEVDVQGKKMLLRRVVQTADALPGVVTVEWYDGRDDLQKSTVTILGMEMTTFRSTLEEVLREDFSSPPEIFFSSSIPVSRRIPAEARDALYRLTSRTERFPEKKGGALFPGAGHEVVRAEGPATRLLRVRRTLPREKFKRPLPSKPELEEFLRANSYIQSDDPEVAAVAEKAAGKEGDAWSAAVILERWVYDNVRDKNLNTAFASAKEVLRTREGDCTEHSVLLAALLRAAGIPARVVAGLVYFDGAFAGHMWTEAWIGGWAPLDATRGRGEVGADHIALSVSSLDSANIAEVFLDILPIIGNVRIEVLEIAD